MSKIQKNPWEFILNGSSTILHNACSKIPQSRYFHLYNKDSVYDHHVEDYRMKSIYCNDKTTIKEACEIGYEFISLFNGANCLMKYNSSKIKISYVLKNQEEKECLPDNTSNNIKLLGNPNISEKDIKIEYKAIQSNQALYLVTLAMKDEYINIILKCFNGNLDFVNFYKILETIESSSNIKNITINFSKTKRKLFCKTANNYSLSGLDSRHGKKEKDHQDFDKKMSIDDAYIFIRDASFHYIKKAHGIKILSYSEGLNWGNTNNSRHKIWE